MSNILKKHSRFLVIFLVMVISSLSLNACAKDTSAPVIKSVSVVGNIITIEASDNNKITGYKVTENNAMPIVNSDGWQESNVFTLTIDGSYYIWAMDNASNVGAFADSIVVWYNLPLKWDHLNWLTPASGTRDIDGITFNLTELKSKYGDLYRFVEPLTTAEIESRFAYIASFYELQREKILANGGNYDWYVESGIKLDSDQDLSNDIGKIIYDTVNKNSGEILLSNDPYFEEIKGYFGESSWLLNTYGMTIESFNSEEGLDGISTDIIDKVSFADKNCYVRHFLSKYEITLKAYSDLGSEIVYVMKDW
jgi:hypothetical protein